MWANHCLLLIQVGILLAIGDTLHQLDNVDYFGFNAGKTNGKVTKMAAKGGPKWTVLCSGRGAERGAFLGTIFQIFNRK